MATETYNDLEIHELHLVLQVRVVKALAVEDDVELRILGLNHLRGAALADQHPRLVAERLRIGTLADLDRGRGLAVIRRQASAQRRVVDVAGNEDGDHVLNLVLDVLRDDPRDVSRLEILSGHSRNASTGQHADVRLHERLPLVASVVFHVEQVLEEVGGLFEALHHHRQLLLILRYQ